MSRLAIGLGTVSLGGLIFNCAILHQSDLLALIWNAGPYLIVLGSAPIVRKSLIVVVIAGVCAMLLVDAWLYLESMRKQPSAWALALSLVATLKMFVVFPAGMLIGYFFMKEDL